MMAAKKIDYAAIFGTYVMKTQFEIAKAKETEKTDRPDFHSRAVMEETIEDYIEQA